MMRPLRNRVYMMISRAVVEVAKDTEGMQTLKATILAGEDRDDIERFQNYGFTSVPFSDAEAIVVCPSGNREHMIAIAVDDRTRRLMGLAEGDVAIYTSGGSFIKLTEGDQGLTIEVSGDANIKADGDTTVETTNATVTASAKAHIDAPAVELGGTAAEAVIKGNTFQALFNAHTHLGNLGYPSGAPIVPLSGSELSTVSKTE